MLSVKMDEFVIKFLKDNDLGSYETAFKEQRISQKNLLKVNENFAQLLIPLMGDRINFLDALKSLKSAEESTSKSSTSNSNSKDGNSPQVSATVILDALYTGNHDSIQHLLPGPSHNVTPTLPVSPTKRVDNNTTDENSGPQNKKARTIPAIVSVQEEPEWFDLDNLTLSKQKELQDYLNGLLGKSLDGQAVLSAYKYSKFGHTLRSILAEILVTHEMNSSVTKRINCDKFKYMALSIVAVFPTESALIYYVPHVNLGHGKKLNPRGKLYEKYTRKMRVYRESGLIPKNQSCDNNDAIEVILIPEPPCDEQLLSLLKWLRTALDPYDRIAATWLLTCAKRIFDYTQGALSISAYFKLYPALTCEFGLKLISIDFQHLHPDKSNALSNVWTNLLENILAVAKRKYLKDTTFKKLISNDIPDLLNVEKLDQKEQNFYCLTILPYLFAPTISKKVANEPIKYSRKESKDNFLFHVPIDADLRPELKRRNDAHQLTRQEIQPLTIVTGTDLSNFTYYVEVNETLYATESLLQAVEYCFQSFMVLNAKYPPAAEKIWLFIQRYIFKIKTKYDDVRNVLPQLEALAVDLGLSAPKKKKEKEMPQKEMRNGDIECK